jgi:hypothetical protein
LNTARKQSGSVDVTLPFRALVSNISNEWDYTRTDITRAVENWKQILNAQLAYLHETVDFSTIDKYKGVPYNHELHVKYDDKRGLFLLTTYVMQDAIEWFVCPCGKVVVSDETRPNDSFRYQIYSIYEAETLMTSAVVRRHRPGMK